MTKDMALPYEAQVTRLNERASVEVGLSPGPTTEGPVTASLVLRCAWDGISYTVFQSFPLSSSRMVTRLPLKHSPRSS